MVATGLALGACDDDDDASTVQPPAPVPQAQPPGAPVTDACSLVPPDAVATALRASPVAISAVPRAPDPARGLICEYLEGATRRIVFVVQVQEAPDPLSARQQAEDVGGKAVSGVGDVARYDQTGAAPAHMAFSKGRRIVRLTSPSRLAQGTMADLATKAAQRV